MSRRSREPWDINKRRCECGTIIEPGNLTDSCNACLEAYRERKAARQVKIDAIADALRAMLNDAKEFGHEHAAAKAAASLMEVFEPRE